MTDSLALTNKKKIKERDVTLVRGEEERDGDSSGVFKGRGGSKPGLYRKVTEGVNEQM